LRQQRLDGRTLRLDYGGPGLAVTFVRPGTVRIRLGPGGTLAPRRSWSPVPPDDAFPEPDVRLDRCGDTVEVAT